MAIEGGLLSPDFLESVAQREGQKPADFGLESRRSLDYEVAAVWSDVRSYWDAFQRRMARAGGESTVTVTREQWLLPLLEALGYRVTYQRRAALVDGRTYAISHRAGEDEEAPPAHLVGCDQELGSGSPARAGLSPHALVQDYLNRSEHLWGLVSNGYLLRLLRDSSYFTRPTYIEFDLRQMLEGELLDEFILFYRLAHRTRLPQGIEDAHQCLLERYHQQAIEEGGRIREGLREAVERTILTLGNGFMRHPKNGELREKVRSGRLDARQLYQELLYLVYRLLFLMVAEERDLLGSGHESRTRLYREHFGMSRLRSLAEEPLSAPERFHDLYLGLRTLFTALREERWAAQLGLTPLNGELFAAWKMSHLEDACLSNRDLLDAVGALSYFVPKDEKVRRRVNYRDLNVEELGSVYESLLDYHPVIGEDLRFVFVSGSERKSTGSYYTRPELVQELIRSALEPVINDRVNSPVEAKAALLSLKVCDPACGSGHFLLAAARRIGLEWARIQTGSDEPPPEARRQGTRLAITHCLYGVDKNPLAVDLCKVALWIEGHEPGKPLTFLDHRIRCGDSLVGVADLDVLREGIPDEAYAPVTGDDRGVALTLRRTNQEQRQGQLPLTVEPGEAAATLAGEFGALSEMPHDTVADIAAQEELYADMRRREDWQRLKTACDLWTAAFFVPLDEEHAGSGYGDDARIPTTASLWQHLRQPAGSYPPLLAEVQALAERHRFFHWPLEFPDVWARGGFDVMLCNPPWEMAQFDDREFFSLHRPAIALAPNMAARDRMVRELRDSDPELHRSYGYAKAASDKVKSYYHGSGRFPLGSHGRVNLARLFAELLRRLVKAGGRAGAVLPTGIATDSFGQHFFADLVESGELASLYDFENREALFPGVHRSYKFCLLTLRPNPPASFPSREGSGVLPSPRRGGAGGEVMSFAFFLTHPGQLRDEERAFSLTREDFRRLNPNTRTCPVFRTGADAELTRKIYRRVPVLVNEATGENPWGVRFKLMFMMNTDSHLFRTRAELEGQGYRLVGNRFVPEGVTRCVGDDTSSPHHPLTQSPPHSYLPLYEAKMIWQFDHRFGSYEGVDSRSNTHLPNLTPEQHADPARLPLPWYWVPAEEVEARLGDWKRGWLLGFRDVTNATNERTAIFSLLPRVGVGHTMPLLLLREMLSTLALCCLLGLPNTLPFDWIARQKMGGMHLTYNYLKQFPVLPPDAYTGADFPFIVPRVLEVVYTAWDMKPFADDVWREADEPLRQAIQQQWEANRIATGGHTWQPPEWAEVAADGMPLPPFRWDEGRRAVLRAELDAYYARLYGLTEEELRYILDPQDVYGPDFPGETFRVLKEKELRQYGEYRTRRLVLEAWGRVG
ncbi:MAG: N-6 DNA methylase [Anaerolineae bacterium]|nr:N-6 DNA methylase [Anaerolineae bacterium]